MIITFLIILTITAITITLLFSSKFEVLSINEELYNFLPKHNCNKCGYDCLGFTEDIVKDMNNISKCPYISDNTKDEINALMRKKKKG